MTPLLVRLPNHLGDTVMTLPALQRLHDGGRALTLIGQPWATPLFEATPWPVTPLPRDKGQHAAVLRGAAQRAGTREMLLFTNSFSTALRARLAGLKTLGYARDGRRLLLSGAFAVPARWAVNMHTVEYYDALAGQVLAAGEREVPPLHLPLSPRAMTQADQLLADAQLKPPFVMLCPGATGQHRGRDKSWPQFDALCRWLQVQGHVVAALPGPGERERFEAVLPGARILPQTDVATFGAVLSRAQLVVANDSGPSHLAAAVGAPLLVLIGVTEPQRTRPWHPQARVLGSEDGWPSFADVTQAIGARLQPVVTATP